MRGAGAALAVCLGAAAVAPAFGQEVAPPPIVGAPAPGQATAGTGPSADPSAERPIVVAPVLTLDRERLFAETLYGKAVNARFKAEGEALIAENLRLEKALETEERDLTDRRPTLPAEEFNRLAADFDTKAEGIRSAQEQKSRAINEKRASEQQRFLEAAIPVLGDLMRDTGAVAIFDKQMIILSLRNIDITDAAIARIDAVLGDGSTKPGATAPAEPTKTPPPDPAKTP